MSPIILGLGTPSAPPEASYKHYRLNVSASEGDWISLAALLLIGPSTPDGVPTGGTASTSDAYGPASNAFDGNPATYWETDNPAPQWIAYEFPSATALTGYGLQARDHGSPTARTAPTAWILEGSNDGSTWVTLDTRSGVTDWTAGATKTYGVEPPPAGHRYWRLDISENQSPSVTIVALGQLELRVTPGGAQAATGGTATASSEYDADNAAGYAFDGLPAGAKYWATANGHTSAWLQYDLGAGNAKKIVQYALTARPAGNVDGTPKAWALQWSDDGSTWTNADTRVNQTAWAHSETRVYNV